MADEHTYTSPRENHSPMMQLINRTETYYSAATAFMTAQHYFINHLERVPGNVHLERAGQQVTCWIDAKFLRMLLSASQRSLLNLIYEAGVESVTPRRLDPEGLRMARLVNRVLINEQEGLCKGERALSDTLKNFDPSFYNPAMDPNDRC